MPREKPISLVGLRCRGCDGTKAQHQDCGDGLGCWCPRCQMLPGDVRCRNWDPVEKDGRKGAVLPTRTAAARNAVGSTTGRVTTAAPDMSLFASESFDAVGQRELVHRALLHAGGDGLTSIEAAAFLPKTAQGGDQVSNRSASRLGELWEEGRAAVLRVYGCCEIGVCHPHDKPTTVHRPSMACETHGEVVTRERAAVWLAISRRVSRPNS